MVGNLGRVVLFLVMFAVVTGLFLLTVAVLSRGIRFAAGYLGYEVGDFGQWLVGGWKKLKRKWSLSRSRKRRAKREKKHGVYPVRCRVTKVFPPISESKVGLLGMAHRTDNGVVVVFLDDGSHLWEGECRFERLEDGGLHER